jgi:hypothetical protein
MSAVEKFDLVFAIVGLVAASGVVTWLLSPPLCG